MGALFRKRLGLSWVSDQDVQHAFGVLKTNGVGSGGVSCHVFPVVSLLSHSCQPNLQLLGSPSSQVQFQSTAQIKKGDELTWSYTNVLQHSSTIQQSLKQTWLFQCACPRCRDPTEFGTFFSSRKCVCGGYELEIGGAGRCNNCPKEHKLDITQDTYFLCELKSGTLSTVMEMMKRLGTINHYHPTHIIHIRTTMRLLDLCVSSPGAEKDLSTQDLQLVLHRGKVLLKTLFRLLGEHTRPFVRYHVTFF